MTTNFDYTKVPGPLLYRGKRHLDDFGVEVNPSLNYFIQERLFQRYSTIPTYEDLANDLFNCTYYICTMALADSHPERRFGAYVEIVHRYLHNFDDYASAALAMILLQMWARRWDMPPHRLKRLADMIKNYLQDNYEKVFREFFYPVTQDMQAAGINKIEYQDEFAPCEINIRLLKDASQYWNWKNEFKKDEDKVWEFVVAIGKTEKEQKYIVEFLREELHSNFENGKEHKYFFENLEYKIHKLHHAAEEKAKLDAEVDAEIERQALEDIENSYARERVFVLEKENAELRENVKLKHDFQTPMINADENIQQQLDKAIKTIKKQTQTINEQQRLIDDYASKFDPNQKGKEKKHLSGKEHVILYLAVLAHHNRIPNARENLSWELSLIAGRAESYMKRMLKEAITQEECDKTAKLFHETTPFIEGLIKELPTKLQGDISEKNRKKTLKDTQS